MTTGGASWVSKIVANFEEVEMALMDLIIIIIIIITFFFHRQTIGVSKQI